MNKQNLEKIAHILWCNIEDIHFINDMTIGGMTNNNAIIEVQGMKYVVRLPGKGTDVLIDRTQEYKVYAFLKQQHLDNITIYLDVDGLKITKYITNAHNANATHSDVVACMQVLKELHDANFQPNINYFSLIGNIDRYRELAKIRNHAPRADYDSVYDDCLRVAAWIERLPRRCCLTHIDANPDNFIFSDCSSMPTLIDWEYAALQDPHLDIAMYAVYCNYDRKSLDNLILAYFASDVIDTDTRYKIYGYCALAGFLWYNWCVYKQTLKITYLNYTENQFKCAKEYSQLVLNYLSNNKN